MKRVLTWWSGLACMVALGCQQWEIRADYWADPRIEVEPVCVQDCRRDLRSFWATNADQVLGDFEPQEQLVDSLVEQTGFPANVDFEERAVLGVYLHACRDAGMVLRPKSLRYRAGVVEGVFRRRNDAVLMALSRPIVFIETPLEWVGDVDLVFED